MARKVTLWDFLRLFRAEMMTNLSNTLLKLSDWDMRVLQLIIIKHYREDGNKLRLIRSSFSLELLMLMPFQRILGVLN